MNDEEQAWAVFWCSLLAPLRLGEVEEAQREAHFRSLAQQEHLLPNGRRRRYSVRTFRRKWRRLRDEGIEGLVRRRRGDRGQARASRQPLLDRAVELKREQPRRSAVLINRILRREFGRDVPPSTLYRHLRRQGATRKKLGATQQKARCRWTRDQPNALWVGDFEHGPAVLHQGRAVETRLSIWIDCHSRFVLDARYYLRENFDVLVDSLLRAWTKHGVSRQLYADNAKIYHANALQLACVELNVGLLHRPPREPEPGGLVERMIQTLQTQLEAEVKATKLLTLGGLNRVLQAWLSEEYHQAIHSETGETPLARHQRAPFHRAVDLSQVLRLFHRREQRTVDSTFIDVTLDGRFYAVDRRLRGDKVEVVFNPFRADHPHECPDEVRLFDLSSGAFLGVGRRYQRQRGDHPPPEPAAPPELAESAYLDALLAGTISPLRLAAACR
jgi:transposase InsO family protein